jgi:hypothetical protein
MMADFETHSIGTMRELQLSRALARSIEENLQRINQYNVMPKEVILAYEELRQHYEWQIENEFT